MPTISIAKREKGVIIHQGVITEGEPSDDYTKAAAKYFIYLSQKYGINGIKLETPDNCQEG